jgi:hypothetical protein
MLNDGDCRAIGGMKIVRGNRSTRRKPAPVPLCPPQIPYDLTPGSNPGRRGGKLVTTGLNYVTASGTCLRSNIESASNLRIATIKQLFHGRSEYRIRNYGIIKHTISSLPSSFEAVYWFMKRDTILWAVWIWYHAEMKHQVTWRGNRSELWSCSVSTTSIPSVSHRRKWTGH